MRFTEGNLRELKDLFKESVDELIRNESFLSKIVNIIKTRFTADIEDLKSKNEQLRRENEILNEKLDGLEQYTRRNSVRVFGVPEEERENVDAKMVSLFNDKLGVPVSVNDIDRCHRVGVFSNKDKLKQSRPIIVKFVSYRSRAAVCKARSRLKATGISIQEDLTASKYKLLKGAREKFGKRNCWTADGRILANYNGSIKAIRNGSDISGGEKTRVSLLSTDINVS